MEPEEISWISRVFRKIDMFSTLSMSEAAELIDHMNKYHFKPGESIIKQGDKGDAFYILYKGKAKAMLKKGFFAKPVELGVIAPEQFFGEMALISDEPRTASVIADEETDCFILFKGEFQHIMSKNPTFEKMIKNLLEKRNFENKRVK